MRLRYILGLAALSLFSVLTACDGPEEPIVDGAIVDGAIADAGRDASTPLDAGPDEDASVDLDAGEEDGGADGGAPDGGEPDAWAPECASDEDCDDGDACTVDTCTGGVCDSAPIDPDDADVCTDDSCDPASGVSHVAVSTDDGDLCTADACDATSGVSHTPITGCCETTADCASGVCSGNVCQPASCTDGVQNDGETDVDCGGTSCAPCALTEGCAVGTDCASGVCVAGSCVECDSAATCPGTDTECRTRTCIANECGFSFAASGTVTSSQVAADCRENQCDGAGNAFDAVLDSDVPVDGNECTADVCTAGVPSNPPAPATTTCGSGGLCDGAGACLGCLTASDCPGTDSECGTRTCTAGTCGMAFTAAGMPVASQTAGDCQQNQCDGAGAIVAVASDTDVPVDGNECTADVCTAGVPSNPPAPAATTCGTGGLCDGAGGCLGCLTASDCPGTDSECGTRTCSAGTCGMALTAAGTPVASQTAGDCQQSQCDGAGAIVAAASDTDVPVDGNECTADVCTAGVPSNPPAPAATTCGSGGLCDGAGACVGCLSASDCPGTDSECATRTCTAGTCGVSFAAAGMPVSAQTAGDCQERQCDGAGNVASVASDADVPADDGNQCTLGVCVAGVPAHQNEAGGVACDQSGGTHCDGAGSCVQCVTASECPGSDTECQMRTCTAGSCGVAHAAEGVPVSTQTAGDCQESQCDGAGSVVSVASDADLPDDGNQCTAGVCTAGAPAQLALAAGTPCSQGGGTECDGAGACVAPTPPAVAATTPADGSSVLASTSLAVTFTTAMSPATLTGQTTAGACSGSIQVSLDDFATCVAFSSASATMSSGDTIATLTAAPGLLVNRIYKIRVTTAATSAAGIALPAQYTHAMGFETGSLPGSNGVVIAQVYGGGGNSGATWTNDFIVLHNRGGVAVDLAGWSVQYAGTSGTAAWSATALTGTIQPGGYYLIQEAAGSGGTMPLPPPDDTGTIAMGGTGGKVALRSTTVVLSAGCPSASQVVDLVGWGASTCFEGAGAAPATTNSTAAFRDPLSCADADDNSVDFTTGAPTPRNSASPTSACPVSVLNESGTALEADYCGLQFPPSLDVTTGASTELVFGRIFEAGVTEPAGPDAAVRAQLGYGPASTNPQYEAGWTWIDATYNLQAGNDDEYQASFTAPAPGSYRYAYRVSLDGGASWTLCDRNGAGSNSGLSFELDQLGVLTVTP